MRFTGPEMMAMSMAAQQTQPEPSREETTAARLIELLHQYNRDEGYEPVEATFTGITKIDRAGQYTGDGLSRKWYQIETTQGNYTESGWMCVDDKWGFKYAEYLDSEEI